MPWSVCRAGKKVKKQRDRVVLGEQSSSMIYEGIRRELQLFLSCLQHCVWPAEVTNSVHKAILELLALLQ